MIDYLIVRHAPMLVKTLIEFLIGLVVYVLILIISPETDDLEAAIFTAGLLIGVVGGYRYWKAGHRLFPERQVQFTFGPGLLNNTFKFVYRAVHHVRFKRAFFEMLGGFATLSLFIFMPTSSDGQVADGVLSIMLVGLLYIYFVSVSIDVQADLKRNSGWYGACVILGVIAAVVSPNLICAGAIGILLCKFYFSITSNEAT
jgi:hypothetical protein